MIRRGKLTRCRLIEVARDAPAHEVLSTMKLPSQATIDRERAPISGHVQGLAISRAIVDRHSGSVTLETSPAGTTFHVRLPIAA